MEYLSDIALAVGAFCVGIASPGPNVMAILATSLSQGRAAGRATAMGVATGSFLWATMTALGLSAVLATYASALIVIKVLGGLYLGWLAVRALRSAVSPNRAVPSVVGPQESTRRHYRRGLMIQMSNPKAVLVWIAIISIGLDEGAPIWVAAAIVATTTLLSVVIHAAYAQAFSSRRMIVVYGRARRGIDATFGALFGVAAVKLLLTSTK